MKLQDVLNDKTKTFNKTLQERGVDYERCRYQSAGNMRYGEAAEVTLDAYRALHDQDAENLPFGSQWPWFEDVYSPEYAQNGEWVQNDCGCDHVYVGYARDRWESRWYAYLFNYGDVHGGADLVVIVPLDPPYPEHCND